MILNPKYGFLGMVQIPISILLPALLIIATLFLLSGFYLWATNWVALAKLGIYPNFYFMKDIFTTSNMVILTFTCVLVGAGFYMLSKSQKLLNEKWRYPLLLIPFFTIYQLILSSYWLVAAGYEVFRIKKKW